MGSDRVQQATLILKAFAQPEASRQSGQQVEAESRWGSQRPGGLLISSICEQGQGIGWGPQIRKGRHHTVPGAHNGGEPGKVKSPWSSPPQRTTTRARAGEPSTPAATAPPHTPNSHPEALVLPATGHSLAIGTPVDSVYLNRGGGSRAVSRVGVVGAGFSPRSAHEGWPHLVRVARQVRGQLLGLHVPHLQCAVAAAADQEPAVGRPRDLVHGSHMAAQGGQVPGPGGRAMRTDVRSWDTYEGCSRPPSVVLNRGCMSGLPGNPYKTSLPGPHPRPI